MKLAAGIDIGGTNTKIGLVDADGNIVCEDSVPTKDFPEPSGLVWTVSKSIGKLLPKGAELIGAGIGAPNGNYLEGTIEFAPNLQWKGIIPLAKLFSEKLNC